MITFQRRFGIPKVRFLHCPFYNSFTSSSYNTHQTFALHGCFSAYYSSANIYLLFSITDSPLGWGRDCYPAIPRSWPCFVRKFVTTFDRWQLASSCTNIIYLSISTCIISLSDNSSTYWWPFIEAKIKSSNTIFWKRSSNHLGWRMVSL